MLDYQRIEQSASSLMSCFFLTNFMIIIVRQKYIPPQRKKKKRKGTRRSGSVVNELSGWGGVWFLRLKPKFLCFRHHTLHLSLHLSLHLWAGEHLWLGVRRPCTFFLRIFRWDLKGQEFLVQVVAFSLQGPAKLLQTLQFALEGLVILVSHCFLRDKWKQQFQQSARAH